MSIYTLRGSEALDAQIKLHLEQIIRSVAPLCKALVLIGGYGRGEGTPFIHPDGSQSPFNDYDLVVVVDKADDQVRSALRSLEEELTRDLGLHVDLCPYVKRGLPGCEFSLLNYEMKHGHRVIWGDESILDDMPAYPIDRLPLSEGTRLLLNRGKLLLDIKQRLDNPSPLVDEERMRFIKFMSKVRLAVGDAALLSEGKYDIRYNVKRERIETIGSVPHRAAVIDAYLDAIGLRNWGDYPARLPAANIPEEFKRTRNVFIDFFDWYRNLHASRECGFMKAMILNLKWNRWPYIKHPRVRLYDALPELLQDRPDKILLGRILSCSEHFERRFYELQARFS